MVELGSDGGSVISYKNSEEGLSSYPTPSSWRMPFQNILFSCMEMFCVSFMLLISASTDK